MERDNMTVREYEIRITGDDDSVGRVVLNDEELATVKKVLNCLKPDGKFAPNVIVTKIPTQEEIEQAKQEKMKKEQEEKEKLYHSGDTSGPSAFEFAYMAAKKCPKFKSR